MGGSSLAPETMRSILGAQDGYPALHVLDSTDPGQILAVERRLDLDRTIFLVASKSGSTGRLTDLVNVWPSDSSFCR